MLQEQELRLVLVLQLGNSAAPNTVTVSDIQVKKISTEDSEIDLGDFAYPVTTGGSSEMIPAGYAAQSLSLSASSEAFDGFKQSASASGRFPALARNRETISSGPSAGESSGRKASSCSF